MKYMLASVAEGYLIRDKIKQAGVPCLVGAVMQPFESLETANATYENAALLQQAGIPIAIMTGYEAYVPEEPGSAIRSGGGRGEWTRHGIGLRAITLSPAKSWASTIGLAREQRQGCRRGGVRWRSLRVHQPRATGSGARAGHLQLVHP